MLGLGRETRLALVPYRGFLGGVAAATGDVNGDGVADVVTAATLGGHVKVFDGRTGAEIRSTMAFPGYEGPIYVATGDLNGDGAADLIVAANLNGHVKVFDGRTDALTSSFFAYAGYQGPVAVAAADTDGDGKPELITAAEGTRGVHVKAREAGTLQLKESFFAAPPGPGGFSLAVGDLDGNGVSEFLVAKSSVVRVIDAQSKATLGAFRAFTPAFPGEVSVQAAQYDGDWEPELVVVGEADGKSFVKVYDGLDGELVDFFVVGT